MTKKLTNQSNANKIIIGAGILLFLLTRKVNTSPLIKYSCSGQPNYLCTQDTLGIYNTLQECQNNCNSQFASVNITTWEG